MNEEKLYSNEQAAEILGLTLSVTAKYARQLNVKKIKNRIFWDEESLKKGLKLKEENKEKRKKNRLYKTKSTEEINLNTLYQRAYRYRKRGDSINYEKTLLLIKEKKGNDSNL